jgi:hypothetical protein
MKGCRTIPLLALHFLVMFVLSACATRPAFVDTQDNAPLFQRASDTCWSQSASAWSDPELWGNLTGAQDAGTALGAGYLEWSSTRKRYTQCMTSSGYRPGQANATRPGEPTRAIAQKSPSRAEQLRLVQGADKPGIHQPKSAADQPVLQTQEGKPMIWEFLQLPP